MDFVEQMTNLARILVLIFFYVKKWYEHLRQYTSNDQKS